MDVPHGRQRTDHQGLLSLCLLGALSTACSSEPIYLEATPPSLTTGTETDPEAPPATLHLAVPFAVENADQASERMKIATELGLPLEQVPSARRDDVDLEIEYTITNNGDRDTVARLAVNGANELFAYDPGAIVLEDDEDAPPPLMGGKPVLLAAGQRLSGVIREDEIQEGAQDLDAFTRGGVIPEAALITRWPTGDVTGGEGGALATIPSKAIPLLLSMDLSIAAGQPVTLSARLRIRDKTGRVRANPTATDVLMTPSTNVYMPPPEEEP